MSTIAQATERQEKLAHGEKLVVTALMPPLATEAFLLPLAMTMHFTWTGLLYGAATFIPLLWATGRLYNGQKNARMVAEALALLQMVVAFLCTILLAYSPAATGITSNFAQPVLWISVVRLGAYALLGLILLLCREVLDFMASRRGEEIASVEPVTASGVVVTFSDAQKEHFAGLAAKLANAGCLLIIAGFLLLGYAFMNMPPRAAAKDLASALPQLGPWLGRFLLPGLVAFLMGTVLLVTTPAARRVQTDGTDRTYLVALLGSLTALCRWQLLLTALGTVAALTSLLVLLA